MKTAQQLTEDILKALRLEPGRCPERILIEGALESWAQQLSKPTAKTPAVQPDQNPDNNIWIVNVFQKSRHPNHADQFSHNLVCKSQLEANHKAEQYIGSDYRTIISKI